MDYGANKMIDSFNNNYFFLSNFFPCKINIDGKTFTNVESAFQSFKCLERQDEFINLKPAEAKHLGKKVKLREDWEDIKLEVMERLLRIKFSDPYFKRRLEETKPHELVEGNFWNDYYWGVCNGKGENHLGKLLMKIRDNN